MGITANDNTIANLGELCANEFFNSLPANERALFQAANVAEALIQEIKDAEVEHKDGSKSRKASSAMLSFIAGINQYAPALDVFANSNELLCPIWGSMRIVLHLAKEFGEYFERLTTMCEDMGDILNKLPRTLRLYPNNENLKKAVMAIYKDIFEFSKMAKHVFRTGKEKSSTFQAFKKTVSIATAFRVVWKPFHVQFGDIKERMAINVTAIESEADMAEKELANQERTKDDVRWSKAEASQKLLAEYIDDQSIAKVNEWLAPVNIAPNHKAATSLRHGDSGTWFLNSPDFERWLNDDNSFLWLHAIPGAGKTILASTVINYLRDHVQSKSTGLAYFYCDYKDVHKQEPSKVLGTILASLGKQNKAVFEAIQRFFLQQYKETSTFTAEFDELKSNFAGFVNSYFRSVIIVIDALDEAGTEHMDCIALALKTLHQQCKSLKVLVTSRNELLITRQFQDLPNTSIEQDDVASDIKNFVSAELSAKILQRRLKLRDPTLELVIRESLVGGSRGMFQWAKCQIEALCRLRNDKAIRAALSNLPKTLQDTYRRILQRVDDEHQEDAETVRKILCWLVKGIRNLTLEELAEAVSIDPECDENSMDFNAVDTDPEQILEVLGSLVTVSADQTISLAHYSVKEYLVSEEIKKDKQEYWICDSDAETYIASVCLTYLCYDDFKLPLLPDVEELENRLRDFKLYRYATQAWALHAHQSEIDGVQPDQTVDLTMRLLHSRDETQSNFNSWIACYRHCKFSKQTRRPPSEPLFVAAFFGLTQAVSNLLKETRVDPALLSESFIAAAANGHVYAVEVMLEYSVVTFEEIDNSVKDIDKEELKESMEVGSGTREKREQEEETDSGIETEAVIESEEIPGANMQGATEYGHQSTLSKGLESDLPKALYAAAAKGHSTVVSLLLSHRTPINARGGRNGTALQTAVLEGRSTTVGLLLDHGASHQEACKRYGTPLSAAAEKAHQRTVDILLDHGASPNGRGGWYSFPLVSAIVGKNINIVRRLIAAGANVNGIGGRHGGPLPAAAAFGMNELIEELVGHGAKVNDNNDKASDALYAASIAGHVSTVDLLLELGADVDAKGGRHRNALGVASAEGNIEVVERLLDAGADIDFHDERWGNALQTAAQRGHNAVVEMLADAGMNPNALSTEKCTALITAASNGHPEIIRTLFDRGVSSGVTQQTTSALVAAALGGHIDTVQLLLERGADVNGLNEASQTASYCTSLQAAAAKGNLDIVRLLIEMGANVNGADQGWYGTVLTAALFSPGPKKDLLQLLLSAGSKINEVSPYACHHHGSPLTRAVSNHDMESTILLLEMGADVNLQWPSFLSPLQQAASQGDDELVDLLLQYGASLNHVSVPLDMRKEISTGLDKGYVTALQAAAWYGHDQLVCRLVSLQAQLSVPDADAPFISALQVAAYRGHKDTVTALIELGSDVNEIGGYFGSALQAAACRGHLDAVRILLKAGANANEVDVGHFHSALLAACMIDISTNIDITKLLVEHGADINQKQKGPYPYPMHATGRFLAGSANDPIDFLLEAGADPNTRGGRYGTAMQAAASQGDYGACKSLLEKGADPNLTGGFYTTPLQAAYREGYFYVIHLLYSHKARNDITGRSRAGGAMGQAIGGGTDYHDDCSDGGACQTLLTQLVVHHNFNVNLEYGYWGNTLQNLIMSGRDFDEIVMILNAGADINRVGGRMGTALNAATVRGEDEILHELCSRGADITLGNDRYPTAAFGAIRSGRMNMLNLLIEKGVNVKDPVGYFGTTLQYAALCGRLSMVRRLLRAGAEINTTDCGRNGSPLQAAITARDEHTIRYLINKGADVRATGGYYGGVLNAAAVHCGPRLVEYLLRRGADVNELGNIYGSPLQAAVCHGQIRLVLLLLQYGAHINCNRGKYGTALQAACAVGQLLVVKLLVEKGADLKIVGGHYQTALYAAAIQGHEKIVRYLLELGKVPWSLINRKRLGHIKSALLDRADRLLERLRVVNAPLHEHDGMQAKVERKMGKKTKGEALPWNVDSIPNALDPYEPPHSKWIKVKELSFHSLSQRSLKYTMTELSADSSLEMFDSDIHDSGYLSRVGSNFSVVPRRFQSRPVSRKTTMELRGKEEGEHTWDSSALNWIQLD